MRPLYNVIFGLLLLSVGGTANAQDLKLTPFDEAELQLRYNSTSFLAADDDGGTGTEVKETKQYPYKSPGKAFALSVLVPGLGQYYYGSRVKPWLFFGAEVTAWVLYFKWDGDYDDLTSAFEQFQLDHWSRDAYREYLLAAYGYADDDSIDAGEVSHHLPDTQTGQYFEMTGKYDQFAWGWDDATRDGDPLSVWLTREDLAINTPGKTPNSTNRIAYMDMRKEANDKYDQARAMILVSLANRLISGFEAFLTTRSHNKHADRPGSEDFSSIDVRAGMRSYNSPSDTPFLTATLRF